MGGVSINCNYNFCKITEKLLGQKPIIYCSAKHIVILKWQWILTFYWFTGVIAHLGCQGHYTRGQKTRG